MSMVSGFISALVDRRTPFLAPISHFSSPIKLPEGLTPRFPDTWDQSYGGFDVVEHVRMSRNPILATGIRLPAVLGCGVQKGHPPWPRAASYLRLVTASG